MSTFLRNKTISKTTPLRKENPFPQFNVASHKRPGIRLSFEYTTTLLSGEGGEGRTGTATMFRKMQSKYTIFSTVLSKIVALKRSVLAQGSRLVWGLRRFQDSLTLGNKLCSGWVSRQLVFLEIITVCFFKQIVYIYSIGYKMAFMKSAKELLNCCAKFRHGDCIHR